MGEIKETVEIQAPPSIVWKVITDIEHSVDTISGIQKVEVLERPPEGLIGLKWRETRTMFGKTATEVMWITHVEEGRSYRTRAESHGAVYISGFDLRDQGDSTLLTMAFEGTAVTLGGKMMNLLMGWMFKKATVEAIKEDLMDIKRVAEDSLTSKGGH